MVGPKEQAPPPQQNTYPVTEAFVEGASPDDVAELFAALKEGLAGLKGPRAEQAKKVQAAIARTEELLGHLLQVRENIEAERRSGSRPK